MIVRRNRCSLFVRHSWVQILQVYMFAYIYIYIALAAWEIMTEGHYLQDCGHNCVRVHNLLSILTSSLIFINAKYFYFLPLFFLFYMCVYIHIYSLSEIYKEPFKKSRSTDCLVISCCNEIFVGDQWFLSC